MSTPFLSHFTTPANASHPNISEYGPYIYDPNIEELIGQTDITMTGSRVTQAQTDPTTDEATDR